MIKKCIYLMGILYIIALLACTQPAELPEDTLETETDSPVAMEVMQKPFVITLVRPTLGAYGYVRTDLISDTSFYSGSTVGYPYIFHIAEKPIKLIRTVENGTLVYWIENEPYICIEKEYTGIGETWPANDYYSWSYDRRFFYKWGETTSRKYSDGGITSRETLYRNMNTDSLEVLILDTDFEWEYLLVHKDSPYASAQTMNIDDFGFVEFNGVVFGRAKDFEVLFYANTHGIDQKILFPLEETEKDYHPQSGAWLSFECTRTPGLRYHFNAACSDDWMKTYVDSRVENDRVVINGPTILPIDALKEASKARAGDRVP